MQVFAGGRYAVFFLLALLFAGFLGLFGLFACRSGNRSPFRIATAVGGFVLAVYCALLLTATLANEERVLSQKHSPPRTARVALN